MDHYVLLFRIKREHDRLEQAVRQETVRRAPDLMRLQSLKKRKLALKDRIRAVEARLMNSDPLRA